MANLETAPILAAIALDSVIGDVVEAATQLARRADAPILPVHAVPSRLFKRAETQQKEAREQILAYFAPAIDEGLTVIEPVLEQGDPAELVLRTASLAGAQLIVAGGGEPATVRRWLAGNVAERIVRHARQPVFVARGTLPGGEQGIVCPVDLSPQSTLGYQLALRMARLFDAPLKVVTVIPSDGVLFFGGEELEHTADRIEEKVQEEVDRLVAGHDDTGVKLEIEVLAGRPVSRILEVANDAHLVVLGSSSFDHLLPSTFGGTTEKIFRGAWASVVTIRDADPDRAEREAHLTHVAALRREAEKMLEAGRFHSGVNLARAAVDEAPGNAALHELLARGYDAVGDATLANDQREVAKMIRESLGGPSAS